MPRTLSPNDANLQAAVGRLRRTQWTWAALSLIMALLSIVGAARGGAPSQLPYSAGVWLLIAILLATRPQPALLALPSVAWALSMVSLIPGVARASGPDPLALLFGSDPIELVLLALIRAFLAITAWNQLMFYRLLYGTARVTGVSPDLPPIPEVVPNRSDRMALAARATGALGLVCAWLTPIARDAAVGLWTPGLALAASVLAIGLGLGSAFSPTLRRGAALVGVGLGALAFLSTFAATRVLIG